MALDKGSGAILLETRDDSSQQVYYHLISPDNHELSRAVSIPEADWWTTLTAFAKPYVILEKFNDPQDPQAKELLIYDLETYVTETHQDFQFVELKEDGLLGHSGQNQIQVEHIPLVKWKTNEYIDLNNPRVYYPGTESHSMVMDFLGVSDEVPCEYLEYKNAIIIGYYMRLETGLVRKLIVIVNEEELLHDIIDDEITGFAPGSFILIENQLIYIENGIKINGIDL